MSAHSKPIRPILIMVIVLIFTSACTRALELTDKALISSSSQVGKMRSMYASDAWNAYGAFWNPCLNIYENKRLRVALKNTKARMIYNNTQSSFLLWLSDAPAEGVEHWRWGRVADIHSGLIIYEGRYALYPPKAWQAEAPIIDRVEVVEPAFHIIEMDTKEALYPIDPVYQEMYMNWGGHPLKNGCLQEPVNRPEHVPEKAVWVGSTTMGGATGLSRHLRPSYSEAYLDFLPAKQPRPDIVTLQVYSRPESSLYTRFNMSDSLYERHQTPFNLGETETYVLTPQTGEIITSIDQLKFLSFSPLVLEDGRYLVPRQPLDISEKH